MTRSPRLMAEIMQEIIRFNGIFGTLPTMQQIADRFGIAAPSVYDIIQALVVKGYLARVESTPNRPYIILKDVEPDSLGLPMKSYCPLSKTARLPVLSSG